MWIETIGLAVPANLETIIKQINKARYGGRQARATLIGFQEN